ncbi:hypothetical protein FisN_14Lh170 [Fistulifera solaris]|uniref:Uncharacterized protein n=1 Tax=Fistulifera solaris TaxID=1519565 RepID=A0A1Z5JA72_FISSO|nr:hypothetical protein FisN_14Lh170 [Fistulifera solaris]|eukprot:GAX10661.1 hypothetical protein FisN_14Lh170 [Fistulifera solaris]
MNGTINDNCSTIEIDEDPLVEYGALSVGVMTLGLILLVEVLRHKIDHEAHGRPFFQAVLSGVYSELATLGIVEFMLYVLNSYYHDLDQKKYKVFADVHFALFYTAILNAFQSVILAVVSNRVAHRIWVKTEMLEVNHYVEIREEFEKVKKDIWFTASSSTAASTDGDNTRTETTKSPSAWYSYPLLRRYRYNQLLLQIRFHELRMHFIDAYKLPIRLKLSDYLLKSQERVLLKLVHVSSMAWLLLTGAVNLLYYLTGIISYEAKESLIGITLNIVFLLCMTTFAGVATLVYWKMKAVFRAIMGEEKLWDVHNADQEERDRLAVKQLELFWGSDPKYVIALLQFMQFGYAVMVSVTIIFWDEVSTSDYSVMLYLALIGFCYAIFVMAHLMAQLVKLDTDSLRTILPMNLAVEGTNAEKRMERANRVARRKTRSEGVAAMAAGSSLLRSSNHKGSMDDSQMMLRGTDLHPVAETEASVTKTSYRRSERRKAKSDGVTGMIPDIAESEPFKPVLIHTKRKGVRIKLEKDDYSIGGRSDADDVPEIDIVLNDTLSFQSHSHFSLLMWLRKYFLSKKYVLVSNVFGTMIAFFFVGKRVERFLHTDGILEGDKYVSFDFKESHSFWALLLMMSAFLIVDITILSVLGFRALTRKERKVIIAAALDILLVLTCMMMFIMAEIARCCDSLGNDSSTGIDDTSCNCAAFGARLYGGLGNIEPYVSLLALRVFRPVLASYLVKCTENGHQKVVEQSEFKTNPFDVFGESTGPNRVLSHQPHGHAITHHGQEKASLEPVSKLWMSAVSRHPEIVEKHGQFSGEILKVMLGIYVENEVTRLDKKDSELPVKKAAAVTYSVNREFSGLSSAAQSIILAGKLGRSVKQLTTDEYAADSLSTNRSHIDKIKFKICEEDVLLDDAVTFKAPNARLVRSMRRCNRKVLPILNHWTAVDVVMTKYEMVYFDATDKASDTGLLEALKATRGGKSLRLKDVAIGRRVVGHLEFSEIESVLVHRFFPDQSTDIDMDSVRGASQVEFWIDAHLHHGEMWNTIKQDQLRIKTVDGRELVLRFYSDLEDAQHHPEHSGPDTEEVGPIYKNNAFQWVQTIGRYCGPLQLKQKLPHFGDQTDEELRDYLFVVKDDHKHHHHRGDLRSRWSSAFPHTGRQLSFNGDHSPTRRGYARPASFGESAVDRTTSPLPRPGRLFQRSKSETEKDTAFTEINERLEL